MSSFGFGDFSLNPEEREDKSQGNETLLLLLLSLCLVAVASASADDEDAADAADSVIASFDAGSVSGAAPFPHYWKRCFGSGHALLGTRVDWREHLQRARTELGVESIRFHGIFDDDMSVMSDDGSYNWYNVDLVYDYMLSIGVRPYVELSFMPSALASACAEDANSCDYVETTGIDGIGPGSYKALENAPGNYEDWNQLVKLFAEHMVERHGLSEVSTWRFEVWNELWGGMDKFPGDLDSPYLHLYNASAVALKHVSPLLQVGGPASAHLQYIPDFIADISALGWPLDFISTHSYPSDSGDGYPCTSASETDPDCFSRLVQNNRDFAAATGLPFYLSEYKEGLQEGPEYGSLSAHADTAYAASFIMHNIPLLEDVDIFSWWTFTYVFEEGWIRGIPFYGGFGLLNTQEIAKPAYRAFQLLNDAGSVRLPLTSLEDPSQDYPNSSTVSAFGTCDDIGNDRCAGLQIFAANFGPMAGSTGEGNEWDPRPRNVTLHIDGLTASERSGAFIYRIDDETTRPFFDWLDMDSPKYLSGDQLTQLHASSQVAVVPATFDETGSLTFEIPAYGCVVIKVQTSF